MLMWKDDIANMVKMVVEMNRDREHFLYQNVDETNIGMSGHSLGGALSIAAAVTLKEVYGIHVKGIVPYSPACIELGQQCEVVAEYAARLHNTRLMLIVGSMDITVPPNTSNFIISQLPRSSSADIHIVQVILLFWDISLLFEATGLKENRTPPNNIQIYPGEWNKY